MKQKLKKWLKIHDDWRTLLKSYSALCSLANALQALSISGLAVLGVISSYMALTIVISLAVIFGLMGFVGRFIKQESISGRDTDYEDNVGWW